MSLSPFHLVFSCCFKARSLIRILPRLAYKSSSNFFFYERKARVVDFFMFSAAKASDRAREREARDFEKV